MQSLQGLLPIVFSSGTTMLWKPQNGMLLGYRGSTKETRGTAYVVYEDIYDAKTAVEHLSGFNVANRYLIVLYYNHNKHSKKVRAMC